MDSLPVHWSEGMFLRPHHFQAWDRYWADTTRTSEQWDFPCNYGIRRLEVSPEAIANYQFQVNVCHARMRDGLLVVLDEGQEPDRVDLKEAFAKETTVKAYLAVPKLRMGNLNVATTDGSAAKSRFVEVRQSVQDESQGGNDQELQFRSLNVRILLSTQDMAGYEVLPLCQIQRAGEQEPAPRLDVTYFPPMLAIDAWPPLGRDIVRAIYDMIGEKIDVLSEQIASREIAPSGLDPGDLERLWMLSELDQAYCALTVFAFAPGIHPLTAYTELCRIVGQLCFFGPDRRPPSIPHYDHDDLAGIFRYIKEQIQALLKLIQPPNYRQRDFLGEGLGMRVAFESEWLGRDWQWFIGVRHNIEPRECLALLAPGGLNWKLASAREVDDVFKLGKAGLRLEPLAQVPRILPALYREWLFFEVGRDSAAWKDVLETQTLAMRLKEASIINRKDLQGKPQMNVSAGGRQVNLQFRLFAVPITRNRP